MEQTTNIQKPQKSAFWIWTTLWLTAFIDSVIFGAGFGFLLLLVMSVFKNLFYSLTGSYIFELLRIGAFIASYYLGSRVAVGFVLKRSVVLKQEATRLAFLTITIPLLINTLFLVPTLSKLNVDFFEILPDIGGTLATIGLVFYSVRKLIQEKGN